MLLSLYALFCYVKKWGVGMLVCEHVSYRYANHATDALTDISLHVQKGEWVAVVGRSGSGKSTLARLLNGLLLPSSGTVTVQKWTTEANAEKIRLAVGFVFQNPDNQIVTTIVEDDLAFGLENRGWPPEQISRRVAAVAKELGIETLLKRDVSRLSGGQKQRVALGGVLAPDPDILVLDEATSMLDPAGQREWLSLLKKLHRKGKTILSITHDPEELLFADRVLALKEGRLVFDGTLAQLFFTHDQVEQLDIALPFLYELQAELHKRGAAIGNSQTEEELLQALWTLHLTK